MKRYSVIIIAILSLLTKDLSSQTNLDSTYYWVNKKYIECVDSGFGVCNCQKLNKYLMLNYDWSTSEITIRPSIYHSWETITTTYKRNDSNIYPIIPSYGIDSGYFFIPNPDTAILLRRDEKIKFIKVKVKTIQTDVGLDMGKQIGILNTAHLLKFQTANCDKSKPLILTQDSIKSYIKKGIVSINCSDDYYYDILFVAGSKTEYFIDYKNGLITIYPFQQRGRYQKIDITTIPDCQTFITR